MKLSVDHICDSSCQPSSHRYASVVVFSPILVLSVGTRRAAREVKNACQALLRGPKKFTNAKEYKCIVEGTSLTTVKWAPLKKTITSMQLLKVVRYVAYVDLLTCASLVSRTIDASSCSLHLNSRLSLTITTRSLWHSVGPANRTIDCHYILGIYFQSHQCHFLQRKSSQKHILLSHLLELARCEHISNLFG